MITIVFIHLHVRHGTLEHSKARHKRYRAEGEAEGELLRPQSERGKTDDETESEEEGGQQQATYEEAKSGRVVEAE